MIAALAIAITLSCLGAATVVVGRGVGDRFRWTAIIPTLAVVQLALIAQAIADVIGLARGHRPAEPATHVAYLVVSLVVLPVVAGQTQQDNGRWAAGLNAGALLIVAVLVIRLQTTWRPNHG